SAYHDSRVREDYEQVVTRVPVYYDRTRQFRDKSDLHPEHPDVDPPPRYAKKTYKLPPPEPDPVWYKWKGDQFIGYDWRWAQTNPRVRENYERHERQKMLARRRSKDRPRRPGKGRGSMELRGWRWVCPGCERLAKVLYLPMAFVNLLDGWMSEEMEAVVEAHKPPPPARRAGAPRGFACDDCHRVRVLSRVAPQFWNAVVGYLTGGLLYGEEVQRPEWLTKDRERPYAPHPHAAPPWPRHRGCRRG